MFIPASRHISYANDQECGQPHTLDAMKNKLPSTLVKVVIKRRHNMKLIYETERLILKVLDETDCDKVLNYCLRNKEFFKEFQPEREQEFYTYDFQEKQLRDELEYIKANGMLKLWIFKKDNLRHVIGQVTFYNIVPYAFFACHLGYKSDMEELNHGFITEAVEKGIEIMFTEYRMHRIEAHVLPNNKPSLRVLEKIGFINEGLAHKFLDINGVWEDHIHMTLISQLHPTLEVGACNSTTHGTND
jgi:ribosomal-protein-alanine N-acetyltransferase